MALYLIYIGEKDHNRFDALMRQPEIRQALAGHTLRTRRKPVLMHDELWLDLAENNAAGAIVARDDMLNALAPPPVYGRKTRNSLEDWRGSVIWPWREDKFIYFIREIATFLERNTDGLWMMCRDFEKLPRLSRWPDFEYRLITGQQDYEESHMEISKARFCVFDIETRETNAFSCVGFSPVSSDGQITNWVLPLEGSQIAERHLDWLRSLYATRTIKVAHNGMFDCFTSAYWGFPVRGFLFDTEWMWHNLWPGLKKSLAFVASIYLSYHQYWKGAHKAEGETLYEYNARDNFCTAQIFLAMLRETNELPWFWPQYARQYLVDLAIFQSRLVGWPIDEKRLADNRTEAQHVVEAQTKWFADAGIENVNFRSSQQMKRLFYDVLRTPPQRKGRAKVESTDEQTLTNLMAQDSFRGLFVQQLLKYREAQTLLSRYYNPRLLHGRVFYSLQSDGTKTGRFSCNQSSLYAQDEIQETQPDVVPGQTIAVWFSCGAASAVAAKLTVEKYGSICNVRIVNNPIKEEDADNIRFLRDVEKWLGVTIEFALNSAYPNHSCMEVWDKRKFMSGVAGAPCTQELKKNARIQWENKNKPDWHVLGFTHDEKKRYDNFVLAERENVLPILIEAKLRKKDCFDIIRRAGIEIPRIYRMGYPNANCIGCVKASSPTYWNHVRKVHPEVFALREEQSRRLGAKLVRLNGERIFLDELPEDAKGKPMKNMDFECGIFCEEKP